MFLGVFAWDSEGAAHVEIDSVLPDFEYKTIYFKTLKGRTEIRVLSREKYSNFFALSDPGENFLP